MYKDENSEEFKQVNAFIKEVEPDDQELLLD